MRRVLAERKDEFLKQTYVAEYGGNVRAYLEELKEREDKGTLDQPRWKQMAAVQKSRAEILSRSSGQGDAERPDLEAGRLHLMITNTIRPPRKGAPRIDPAYKQLNDLQEMLDT